MRRLVLLSGVIAVAVATFLLKSGDHAVPPPSEHIAPNNTPIQFDHRGPTLESTSGRPDEAREKASTDPAEPSKPPGKPTKPAEPVISLGEPMNADFVGEEVDDTEPVEIGPVMDADDHSPDYTGGDVIEIGESLDADDMAAFESYSDSDEVIEYGENMDVEEYLRSFETDAEVVEIGPAMQVD